MKKQNSFTFALLVLFAMVPCFGVRAFSGTIRSDQCYTWGINTDTVAIPAGSVITEAVLTIHNLTSSSNNEGNSLYTYLLDEPRAGFLVVPQAGSGNSFEENGVLLVNVNQEQSQNRQDVDCTFSELAVEFSPLWEHFGYPLVFGPDDQMVIESSLVLDLIDYAGSGTSFGFGFNPNGNVDYNFDQITLELTIESFEGPVEQSSLILTTTGEAGLIGHWTMDDNAANTTVVDSSGNTNDGIAQYNTSVLHQTGVMDGALDFDSTSDYYIDCGNDASLDITGSVSISAWVNFDTLSTNFQTIVAKRGAVSDNAANYVLRTGPGQNQDQIQFYYHDGTNWHVYTTSNANLVAGEWYHIAATFTFGTGSSMKCYVDNNLLTGNWNLGDGNSPVPTNTKPVTIGGLTTGKYLDGIIDNVMIFNKALSQQEIDILYNSDSGTEPENSPVNNAPIINPIGNKSISENQVLSFIVNANDPDGDAVTCSAQNLPGGATFDTNSRTFNWVPTEGQAGQYSVTFTASDSNLTDTETITITVNSNLVAHWTMDDNAANTVVADSSGNNNNGIALYNTSVLQQTGIIDGALDFDGANDYIDCGNDTSLDTVGSVTISAWVNFDTVSMDHQTIVAKRGAVADHVANYVLRTGPGQIQDQLQFYYHDGTNWHVYTTSNANLVAGRWYHITATFTFGTGSSMKCYVNNNVLIGNWNFGDGNSSVPTNTKPLTIGGLTTGKYLDGIIDNVKIFNKVLSQQEIEYLYYEGGI